MLMHHCSLRSVFLMLTQVENLGPLRSLMRTAGLHFLLMRCLAEMS